MAFCANYKSALNNVDLARYEEKVKVCGIDPYDLKEEDCCGDVDMWPSITEVDRLDYFVYSTNFVSKSSMKCLKSLEAHTFFTSGHVFPPLVKEVGGDRVLILGRVKHSQSASLEPLKAWLLVHKDGEIVCGHCTCMAGLAETCSHVAAIVFMVEYAVKVRDGRSCTEIANAWLPPNMKNLPFKEVREIDFSAPSARLMNMYSSKASGASCEDKPSVLRNISKPTAEALRGLLHAVHEANPKAIVLGSTVDFRDGFIPPEVTEEFPKLMSSLWDPNAVGLGYDDLLVNCKVLIQDFTATSEEVKKVEQATRKQAKSDLWFKFRQGRITASNMHLVCRGNTSKPARSTINKLCYGGKCVETMDTKRGKQLEGVARQEYAAIQKENHPDLKVEACGLFLSPNNSFIAASPDGIFSCSCCEGVGGLEIKCPRDENAQVCFDKDGNLMRHHPSPDTNVCL